MKGAVLVISLFLLTACETSRKPESLEWMRIDGGHFSGGIAEAGRSQEERAASRGARALVAREVPAREVEVKQFEVTKSEVTVAQFQACVTAGVCIAPPPNDRCSIMQPDSGPFPMNCVNWQEAATFCAWAGGRLLSEVEWEYAARSRGKRYRYPWGNDKPPSCSLAVTDEGGRGCGRRNLWPVCSKPRGNTEQGLCDMAGNAAEWTGGELEGMKVVRGGGIGGIDDYRTTLRETRPADARDAGVSFRCARDLRG